VYKKIASPKFTPEESKLCLNVPNARIESLVLAAIAGIPKSMRTKILNDERKQQERLRVDKKKFC
jgi:hypothetical protein